LISRILFNHPLIISFKYYLFQMLTKYQFLKRLSNAKALFKPILFQPALYFMKSHPVSSKHLNLLNRYSFTSTETNQNTYQEDISLIKDFTQEQITEAQDIMAKYAAFKGDLMSLLENDQVERISDILFDLAENQLEQGNIEKARTYLTERLDLYQKAGIRDIVDIAHTRYTLACLSLDNGDINQTVEDHLNEAQRICRLHSEDAFGKQILLGIWSEFGEIYQKRGETDKAIEIFQSILERADEIPELNAQDKLFNAYRRLGSLWASKGDLEKAVELSKEGIELAIKERGENSEEVYYLYTNLSDFLINQEKFTEAFDYAERMLQIIPDLYPENDGEYAATYSLIAYLNLTTDNPVRALEFYTKAAKIYEQLPPEDDIGVLSSTHFQIALVLLQLNRKQQASDAFKECCEFVIRENGQDHVKVAETYFNWGQSIAYGSLKEAKPHLKKALEIYKKQQTLEAHDQQNITEIYKLLGKE